MPNDPLFDTLPNDAGLKAKTSLAFAKLVATPTDLSWSQVYNAGNLFACLSLTIQDSLADDDAQEPVSLHALGKDILSILESEFFTLEKKSVHAIKEAIKASINHVPSSVVANLSLALFKDSILYVFIAGGGKILMKRGGKVGTLLENVETIQSNILTASGFLHNNDMVIIETEQFAKDISTETIDSALELALPSDIAEALSPQIHEKDDGGQAAIIITYKGVGDERSEYQDANEQEEAPTQKEHAIEELYAPEEEEPVHKLISDKKHFSSNLPHIKLPGIRSFHLSHRKKLFLSVAVLILALLVASIVFTRNKQGQAKQHELFVTIFEPAQKSYDEGKALESLNKSLSRDDFLRAEKLLKDNQGKFEKESSEAKQLSELLAKVQAALGPQTSSADTTSAKEAAAGASSLLEAEKSHADGLAFGHDGTVVYIATAKAVTRGQADVIKNDKDWEKPQAITPYQGNLYMLDQKNGLLKYTAGGTGYVKSSYFKKSPDLSTATGMAVDGSVWILLADGSIYKYTKGESDGFKIKGLEKPFSSPTKLFTNLDTESIYILDRGNGRVVKLAKDGTFQSEYVNKLIQQAKDFDISEEDKKIYILSGDKIYEISSTTTP
jgi:hypothetical protein